MNGVPGRPRLAARAALLVLWLGVAWPALAQVPFRPHSEVRTTTKAEEHDGPLGIAAVGWQAEQNWAREQYAALDEMFARLANPTERLTDGRWQLPGISSGLSHHFQAYKEWDHM